MKKGNVCIMIGLLLLAAALCIVGYNICENRRAGKYSENYLEELVLSIPDDPVPEEGRPVAYNSSGDTSAPEARLEYEFPDYVLNPEMELPVKIVDNHGFVGVLRIPSLGIELPVCSEWNYNNLQIAPCLYNGTPYLGDFVICAHNFDIHFGNIKHLNYGDLITFTDIDGNVFRYIVEGIETLQPEAIEEMTESGWDLTLFTCTIGGRTRVTVRCSKAFG